MLLVAGALIAGPVAFAVGLVTAREKALDVKLSRTVELASSEIVGKVGYADGTSVAAQAPVRVWSVAQAAFVHQTTTGADGAYRLPALEQGTYQLVFADRVRVELHITEAKSARPAVLDVVIPHGRAVFADMPTEQQAAILTALAVPAAVEEAGLLAAETGSGLLPAVAIGAGSITAVAAVAGPVSGTDRREVNSP